MGYVATELIQVKVSFSLSLRFFLFLFWQQIIQFVNDLSEINHFFCFNLSLRYLAYLKQYVLIGDDKFTDCHLITIQHNLLFVSQIDKEGNRVR